MAHPWRLRACQSRVPSFSRLVYWFRSVQQQLIVSSHPLHACLWMPCILQLFVDPGGTLIDKSTGHNRHSNSPSRLNRLKRRDRLDHAFCTGEPENPDPAFQLILDQAYVLKNESKISEVVLLLAEHTHLPKLPYQEARSQFLLGQHCEALEDELEKRNAPYSERDQDFPGQAADHYARGAEIARRIPDKPLFAQFKELESKALYYSHPRRKRYRRAFEAAKEALDVWGRLPRRKIATDMAFGFKLGDLLGLTAGVIGEDAEAVRGLDYAAHRLFDLQHRPDADPAQYANDELFLDWDWAYLFYTMGHYRHAFKVALRARKKGRDLFTAQNRARFQWLIASIMLACAEEGGVGDYSYNRLMAASDKALDEAYAWAEKGKEDRTTFAMILLVEAKWMGLSRNPRTTSQDRIEKIKETQTIASACDDILLLGQAEIAWGDEYAFQNASHPTKRRKEAAKERYMNAIEMLEDVEALSLARIARLRLERLLRTTTPYLVAPSDLNPSQN